LPVLLQSTFNLKAGTEYLQSQKTVVGSLVSDTHETK
jgi:hypothetical protein